MMMMVVVVVVGIALNKVNTFVEGGFLMHACILQLVAVEGN
jgi:hypothetical protein